MAVPQMVSDKAAKMLIAAILLLSGVERCRAEIFRYVDEAGHTVFSNMPRHEPPPAPAKASAPIQTPLAGAFFRIAPHIQRERDAERRRIIDDELATEEAAAKQAALKGHGKSAERHEANVHALRRELSSMR